jgi:hypothetical protein
MNEDDVTGCAAPGLVLSYGMWQSEFGAPKARMDRHSSLAALQAINPGLMGNTLPSGYGTQSISRYRDYRLEAAPAPRA